MNKNLFDTDLSIDDIDGFDEPGEEVVYKKCHCGHRGPLIQDVDGMVCENCSYLLVPKTVDRKPRSR